MANVLLLAVFWALQVAALVCFKQGAGSSRRIFLICFLAANVMSVISTWPLMLVYRTWPANVVLALQVGVGFVIGQIVLALMYPPGLTLIQLVGVVAITAGIGLVSFGAMR